MTFRKVKKLYKDDQLQIFKKFAWTPKKFTYYFDNEIIIKIVWLKCYFIIKKYDRFNLRFSGTGNSFLNRNDKDINSINNMLLSKSEDDVSLARGIINDLIEKSSE